MLSKKGQLQLEVFRSLFPNLYSDGMTVSYVNDVLWINPTPGKRGRRYMFIVYADGAWRLDYV